MLLFYIFTKGCHPFQHRPDEKMHDIERHIEHGEYDLGGVKHIPQIHNLLKDMLHEEITRRPSTKVVLK